MRILVFTGSRGEWGYLRPILNELKNRKINFKICATNMLLLDGFGMAVKEIEKEGFKVDEKIYMALDGYNVFTATKSMGVLLNSFTDTVQRIKPDWILLAGDRGETLVASIVGIYTNTPVAHIQAGELSGNVDGLARHSIGKFSHIHFSSNKDASDRLKRFGEEHFRIKEVGAPQLDDIYLKGYIPKNNNFLFKKYGIRIVSKKYLLVVYHPVVESINSLKKEFNIFMRFLKKIDLPKIWISSNNDAGSEIIKSEFYKHRDTNDTIFENIPRHEYLSLLKNTKCIIGNSSSGIIESSSFKVPCINVGRRQNDRIKPKNVVSINKVTEKNLLYAYKKISSISFKNKIKKIENPYGSGKSSKKIVDILINTKIDDKLIKKNVK